MSSAELNRKPVEFELAGERWLQATVEVIPPSAAKSEWWSALIAWAQDATALENAHVITRFEHAPGEAPHRTVGIVLPEAERPAVERWLGGSEALMAIAKDSPRSSEEATPFWNREFDYVAAVPVNGYSIAEIPVACDYRLLGNLERLMVETIERDIPWCYQLNAVKRPLDAEERRATRKNLARLEAVSGIPERVLRWQAQIVEAAERAEWRCAELIALTDRKSLGALEPIIARDFASSHGKKGFEPLSWPSESEDVAADAWVSGLHPHSFTDESPARVVGAFIDRESLPAAWTCRFATEKADIAPPSNRESPVVFLSYSTRDRERAFTTCRILEEEGISCWIAPRDIAPGREWAEAIVTGIKQTQVTVVLLSAGSNLSRYVLRELELSVNDGHPLIPVRLEECRLNDSIQFFLTTHQWFDAMLPPFESHVRCLVESLRSLLR